MNTGPPTSAAATPSFSSCWNGSTRIAMSATSSTIPANSADGTSRRCGSCPTNGRITCGATMPTNPMVPAVATLAPASSDVPPITSSRVRFGSAPRLAAVSSPRLSALRPGPATSTSAAPIASAGAASTRSAHERFATDPIIQFTRSDRL